MKKLVILFLLALGIIFSTITFAEECMEGDCDDGTGTGFTEEGKLYSGEWKDGKPHGIGKLTISKGKHLEGRWEKGQLVEDKKADK